jgi:hypothetical protein
MQNMPAPLQNSTRCGLRQAALRSLAVRCGLGRAALRGAFSFVEIMVVVALLSVIVLGLMAMFNQTQRAFRIGMSQTDILESGRIATDLIARELEQATPCYYSNYLATKTYAVPNFIAQATNISFQSLPGSLDKWYRTNVLQDLFFVTRLNQTWTGIGYFVRTNLTYGTGIGPAGILYRFETNCTKAQFEANPSGLFDAYNIARSTTNFSSRASKILDGVVEFRVQLFDTQGWLFTNNPAWWVNPSWNMNFESNSLPAMLLSANLMPVPNYFPGSIEDRDYPCFSNAVPAFVELELGILEQQAYDQYKSIPIQAAQLSYMANQAGHVHVFRQRITVRNVDGTAYTNAYCKVDPAAYTNAINRQPRIP